MARLLIVVGLPDSKPTAEPSLVYLGRSGQAMRVAMDCSPAPRFIIFNHPIGIPKNNPRAAANAAALAARPARGARRIAS
jgi:hypothetical protein